MYNHSYRKILIKMKTPKVFIMDFHIFLKNQENGKGKIFRYIQKNETQFAIPPLLTE